MGSNINEIRRIDPSQIEKAKSAKQEKAENNEDSSIFDITNMDLSDIEPDNIFDDESVSTIEFTEGAFADYGIDDETMREIGDDFDIDGDGIVTQDEIDETLGQFNLHRNEKSNNGASLTSDENDDMDFSADTNNNPF
ncbi:TPA: hypothetical protein IAA86_01570 [Candidatus Galligastranaerophilus intestinavium]|uniref:EF-hand domain-containing protein n=1 Tax=Candidatus Galligastranaerophilus intestinavium TaxID=2840836 RepID=A0A9D1FH79_9BACT|nr:hypothetical protein [Candidatus Galligastranaerophilus intestinavium]